MIEIVRVDENYECDDAMVSHPKHYQSSNGLEVIDIIEDWTQDFKGILATDLGNVIKYVLRFSSKNGVQDLNKALWYLQHHRNKVKDKGAQHYTTTHHKGIEVCNAFAISDLHRYAIIDIFTYCTTGYYPTLGNIEQDIIDLRNSIKEEQ